MAYSPLYRSAYSKAASYNVASGYQNSTASNITLATPVYTNTSGTISPLDVTSETSSINFIGLVSTDVPIGATGQVISSGRIQNIPSGLGFALGDAIYAGTTPGSLTNIRPDTANAGWTVGMFVIFIGVVVKNETNPSNQDLQINWELIGQL